MTPPTPAAAAAAVSFRRFDVVSDPSDHSFLSTAKAPNSISPAKAPNSISPEASKTIFREWKILEQHLPDSIFVRVYENQIDILRAAIVGAAGTPYHDGLYFFDIAFPTDYPQSPPKVAYRSYGLRINPNLYPSGRVCLSLINTWSGTGVENWNPRKSTILQVLVSIQGLVLNENPYFNDPLLLPWFKNDRQSNSFNEQVFELCCKTMLHVIWKPPRNFERLVWSHFRKRRFGILKAIEAYANGKCRVGSYSEEGNNREVEPPSAKFKRCILQLHLQLSGAIDGLGASSVAFEDKSARRTLVAEKKEETPVVVKGCLVFMGIVMGILIVLFINFFVLMTS
ncbi:Putative ubiquitin-conjugating enzyme E2 38 [Linum grandiflorum]